MQQKKLSVWSWLKYLYVLPVAATTLVVFARTKAPLHLEEGSNSNILLTENWADMGQVLESNLLMPDDSIYMVPEVLPEFPGGGTALFNYIGGHLVYPKEAFDKGIQGRVICTFVIEKDGAVSNVVIFKSVDPLLDAEAVRVISSLPHFFPGKIGGKPVRVRFSIPVKFSLPENHSVVNPSATNDSSVANDPASPTIEEGKAKKTKKDKNKKTKKTKKEKKS